MGVVYPRQAESLNRPVALKMILSGHLPRRPMCALPDEAEAAANLDHPNILPIYEVGEHEGQQFFSMKLIDGGSLPAAWRNGHQAARAVGCVAKWPARFTSPTSAASCTAT